MLYALLEPEGGGVFIRDNHGDVVSSHVFPVDHKAHFADNSPTARKPVCVFPFPPFLLTLYSSGALSADSFYVLKQLGLPERHTDEGLWRLGRHGRWADRVHGAYPRRYLTFKRLEDPRIALLVSSNGIYLKAHLDKVRLL
jgi:hypothetical protein